jgi:putative hemin transport protein
MNTAQINTLKERWNEYRSQYPKNRIREAAAQLGVSEAELLATGCGEQVIRLEGDFRELLKEVPRLEYVMALTRNNSVVHERKGAYQNVSFNGQVGLVLGEDIDLRLFMNHWQFGFAVRENERQSLQFFAADGEAVHKIYLTSESNADAYQSIVNKYRSADQSGMLSVESQPRKEVEKPDSEIDVSGFQQAWLNLQDTHAFFGLLRKYQVSRLQALRLAPAGYAYRLTHASIRHVLEEVARQQVPIMVFVASRGCIQIHTGEINRLVPTGPWYNVLDPEFNLHLREDQVASIWVVKKPTDEGIVTSMELFDEEGNNLALVFGKRKPGIPEKESWRQIIAERGEKWSDLL